MSYAVVAHTASQGHMTRQQPGYCRHPIPAACSHKGRAPQRAHSGPPGRYATHDILVTDGEEDRTQHCNPNKEGWPHYLNQQAQFNKQMCLDPHFDMDGMSLWQL